MKIVLCFPDRSSFILESESTDTVYHIKEKVHSITDVPPDQTRFFLSGGKPLEDRITLASVGVKEGTRLSVVYALRGGGPGEIERPLGRGIERPVGRQERKDTNYCIYYGDAFQSGWRDEHVKELLQLLLKDGTVSGGNITDESWRRIQNGLNNSQNCNFQIAFLKERLRGYKHWYSFLVETSSKFRWDIANKFIRIKSDERDYEMPLSEEQISFLKCLQMLIHQEISQISNIRTVGMQCTLEELALPSTMKIVVRLLNGRCFILESVSTDTIDHVKEKVHSIADFPPDQQMIIYRGIQLYGGSTLAYGSIKEGSLVDVVPRLYTGGPGEIERPLGSQEIEDETYNIYNICYADAFQSGWRDEHDKELLQLLLNDGTISGGNITDESWLRIQNGLNNSQNCNFQIDFLKERLRDYKQCYSFLVETSSIFHWDRLNKFIRVKSDERDYEMSLSEAQISYLKCLRVLVHQEFSWLSNSRTVGRQCTQKELALPSTMKIVVEIQEGGYFILEVLSTDTADHIKEKVHSITDIPPDYQHIYNMNNGEIQYMVEGRAIQVYNVKEGSRFYVNVSRIRDADPGEIERTLGRQERADKEAYNIYYADAFQSAGWRDEHDKELLQLLLNDGTISGRSITGESWLRIQNGLNNSQNCNFQIDFLKERLRDYKQWYSFLVETSSIFHWDLANKFIRVKSDEQDYEMPLSGAQISYLKCLQMLVHQDISQLSNKRTKFHKFRKCLKRLLPCSKTG